MALDIPPRVRVCTSTNLACSITSIIFITFCESEFVLLVSLEEGEDGGVGGKGYDATV